MIGKSVITSWFHLYGCYQHSGGRLHRFDARKCKDGATEFLNGLRLTNGKRAYFTVIGL